MRVAPAVALMTAVAVAVSCAPDQGPATGSDRDLGAAIAEIEAGQATTPLIEQPAPGADATITFLVESAGIGARL